MMDARVGSGTTSASFERTMSSGCSNILRERRHCLRGRINGFPLEFFRTALGTGEAEPLLRPVKGCLKRGPSRLADEFFGMTRSCGGDSLNMSPSDMELDRPLLPLPNLKGGGWLSGDT